MKAAWMLVVCGLAAVPGCRGDECQLGEARCDRNVALVCDFAWSDSSAPRVFRRDACGARVCVETTVSATGRDALCALAARPDPRCPASSRDVALCADGHLVECKHGYATSSRDCGGQGRCIDRTTIQFCALADAPDPRCPAQELANVCDGDRVLTCRFGYREIERSCGPSQACVASVRPGGTSGNVFYVAVCQPR